MRGICLFIFLIVLTSCAQVHNKYKANALAIADAKTEKFEEEKGLLFSAELNSDLCSPYFGYIEIAIENNTQDWVDIEKIKIVFENKSTGENTFLTIGKDFLIWKKGMLLKKSISDYNKKLVLGMISLGGAVLSSTSDDENLTKGGFALMSTGLSVMALDEYYENKANKFERASIFPENHLLYGKIRIPPGFFVRKFVLLQTRNEDIDEYLYFLNLNFIENGQKSQVKLKFRNSAEESTNSDSDWMEYNYNLNKIKEELRKLKSEQATKTTTYNNTIPFSRVSYIYNLRTKNSDFYKKLENFIKEKYPEDFEKSLKKEGK